jgi:hypothetical protein
MYTFIVTEYSFLENGSYLIKVIYHLPLKNDSKYTNASYLTVFSCQNYEAYILLVTCLKLVQADAKIRLVSQSLEPEMKT